MLANKVIQNFFRDNFSTKKFINYKRNLIVQKNNIKLKNIFNDFNNKFTKFIRVALLIVFIFSLSLHALIGFAEDEFYSDVVKMNNDSNYLFDTFDFDIKTEDSQEDGVTDEKILINAQDDKDLKVNLDNDSTLRSSNFLELDLFEENNLDDILLKTLDIIEKDSQNKTSRTYNHFKILVDNADFMQKIKNIKSFLRDHKIGENRKQLKIIKQLKAIEKILKENSLENHSFFGFVHTVKMAYKVKISRRIANEILKNNRKSVEEEMNNNSSYMKLEMETKINVEGVELGISIGVKSSEGASELSFYQTENSLSIKLSIGIGNSNLLSLSVADTLKIKRILIYRSLEQFLDTDIKRGQISTIRIRNNEIENIINSRKNMQQKEKKLLANISASIVNYLKALGVIDQNTKIKLPDITQTNSAKSVLTKKNTFSLQAEAQCLVDAGIRVSTSSSLEKTRSSHPYLELIDKNCLPSEIGKDFENICRFLKAEKYNKFNEIKKRIPGATAEDINNFVNIIKGDLSSYNWALSVMSNKNASKEDSDKAELLKHRIEENWLTSKFLKKLKNGRLDMLKAAISISVLLRSAINININESMHDSFEEIYYQMEVLSKMQMFTNSLKMSKKNAEFLITEKKNKTQSLKGEISIDIPKIGKTSINFIYTEDNPNSKKTKASISFSVELPLVGNKIIGNYSLQKTLNKVQKKLSKSENKVAYKFAEVIEVLKRKFNSKRNILGYNIMEKKSNASDGLITSNLFSDNSIEITFYFEEIKKSFSDYPLPGQSFCNKPNVSWFLKSIEGSESKTYETNFNALSAVNIKGSKSIIRSSNIIGSDSLRLPVNKFNIFELSLSDRKDKNDKNYLWNSFKKSHKNQFKRIFKNITKSNSNSRYELQIMYNKVMKKAKGSQKNNVNETFVKFLNACQKVTNECTEANYIEASDLFDEVLKLNYNFKIMNV